MFTGIIQNQAKVTAIHKSSQGLRLSFYFKKKERKPVRLGESIAVNGVCLTAVEKSSNGFSADVIVPTLQATTMSSFKINDEVNIERALKLGDSMGGHVVSGHVNGTAQIKEIKKEGNGWKVSFLADKKILKSMELKGSVAIDGVSLTIQHLNVNSFSVGFIPHTFQQTIFKNKKEGDHVNIETDAKPKLHLKKTFRQEFKSISQLKRFLTKQGF